MIRIFSLILTISVLFANIDLFRLYSTNVSHNNVYKNIPIIVLDAGHGGEDGGACSYGGMAEKELNLIISKDICEMLQIFGINVIMTRTDDTLLYDKESDFSGKKKSMDLSNRLKIANSYDDAIFVSIHMNAFPIEKYRGLQVYYSEKGQNLSQIIQNNVRQWVMPYNKRKEKKADKNIFLMDRFKGEGVLIECGFLSNIEENRNLNSKEYRKILSLSICLSIVQYLNEKSN